MRISALQARFFSRNACSPHKLKQIPVVCPPHSVSAHNNYCSTSDLKFPTTIVPDFLFPVVPSNVSRRAEREAGRLTSSLRCSAIDRDGRLTYHFTCCWCCGGRSSGPGVGMSAEERDLTAAPFSSRRPEWLRISQL